jgi:DNA polymerase elongation subunit (family B)
VLGYGKIEDNRKICEQWDEDPQLLLDYNVQDVKLTVDLEEKEDIIKFNEEKADFAGGRIAEVIDPSQAVDMYILHVVHEAGYVLPSSATVKSGEDFEGGQVFDPSTGIKEMVEVLDLASLYPMSMKTLNAGPTTKDSDGDITAPNGVSFTTEKDSIISEIIDDLLEERQAKKDLRDQHAPGTAEHEKYDRQQRAVKVIMNTLYGVMGWDRFRLYDKDVGAAVTAVGRECIIFTQELVEEMGYDVIYGDTDSVMVELGGDVSFKEAVQIGLELEDEINSKYDDFAKGELGVDEHWFEMEFEKLYRRFFQAGKKKRYAGHVIWDEGDQVDKVGIVGLEYKRSDYSTVAREIQKEIVSLIVRGASFDEISNVLQQEVKKIQNRYYDWDDLGIPGGISKAFDDYKSKTLTVKGAEYANKHLGAMIQSGDKPKGIYIEKAHSDELPSPDMKTPYVCWMDEGTIDSVVPEELSIDWEKYLQAQIEGPLSRIFEGTDWDYDGMLTGQLQGDMFEYSNDDNSEDGMFEDVDISDTSSQDTSNNEENGQNQYENSDPVLEEQDDEQKVQTGLGDF